MNYYYKNNIKLANFVPRLQKVISHKSIGLIGYSLANWLLLRNRWPWINSYVTSTFIMHFLLSSQPIHFHLFYVLLVYSCFCPCSNLKFLINFKIILKNINGNKTLTYNKSTIYKKYLELTIISNNIIKYNLNKHTDFIISRDITKEVFKYTLK